SLLATSSLAYTFQSGLAAPELRSVIDIQVAPLTIVLSVLLILPVAAVFASLLLAISIYARSYKEAQSYMMPLQFAVIIPAMLSLTPNLQLAAKVSWIPILNVALALRELLTASGAPPPWAH